MAAMLPSIALAGRSGSGKSTAALYLAERYNYAHVRSGALCREISKKLFDSDSKQLLNQVTDAMRAIRADVWISAALRSQTAPQHPIVFDSMRWNIDRDLLLQRGFVLWQFTADRETRIGRLAARGQQYDPAVDENHPVETELELAQFDWRLDTSSLSAEELYASIDAQLA